MEQLTDEVVGLREQLTGLVAMVSTLVRKGAPEGQVQTSPTADSASSSAQRSEERNTTSRKHKARADEDDDDDCDDEGMQYLTQGNIILTKVKMTPKQNECFVRFESETLTIGMKRRDGFGNGVRWKMTSSHEDEATR